VSTRRLLKAAEAVREVVSMAILTEVRDGLECGIKVANFNDIKEGDVLECYRIEEVARTLS